MKTKKSNVPTTKNAFNLRRKAEMPVSDDENSDRGETPYSPNKENSDHEYEDNNDDRRSDDEESMRNTSTKKPIFGNQANAKAFGSNISKPDFTNQKGQMGSRMSKPF